MKLDEAIEIKTKVVELDMPCWMPKALKADKLALEALKQVKKYRELKVGFYADLLPGETKN